MNTRRVAVVVASIIVGCLILTSFTGSPAVGQPAVAPDAPPGRYQIVVSAGKNNDVIYVLDSHTGQVWCRDRVPGIVWTDLGSPVAKAKK
jgi:hypothetical protein